MPYTQVLFEEVKGKSGYLGMITLNRPEVLNSLTHSMVLAIDTQLSIWETAPQIKAVLIKAAPGSRAFCAGGDIRHTYENIKAKNPAMVDFFRDEYSLNKKIFHYPKPYIALLDGITMGGGVGISIHGSHRVATERLIFAMPETGIGFFPDVGGTYFLPRISNHQGYYLGLTGVKIASDDCVQMGIANHKVAEDCLPKLIQELTEQPFNGNAKDAVSRIIETFKVNTKETPLMEAQLALNQCFSRNTIEEILEALAQSENKICQEAGTLLPKKSPTSLKVTLKAMQMGLHLDFDACMQQEYRLVSHFLQEHDFAEGIRAVIIDKDQKPNWQPNSLQALTHLEVNKYFEPLVKELI